MTQSFPSQPHSADDWKKYARSKEISYIPATVSERTSDDQNNYWMRGVFFEVEKLLRPKPYKLDVVADVLAFEPETVINLADSFSIVLQARVLTANGPVHVRINPNTKNDSIVIIYGDTLDVEFTYSTGDGPKQPLKLDGNQKVGLKLIFKSSTSAPTVKWISDYEGRTSDREVSSLNTQVRIASVWFWSHPDTALSLATYVAKITATNTKLSLLNLQAVSLGQQLAIQKLIEPVGNYIPALNMEGYLGGLKDLFTTAESLQDQFYRVQNRELALKDRLRAWDSMAKGLEEQVSKLKYYRQEAYEKYKQTQDVVDVSSKTFEADQVGLEKLQKRFKDGIDAWKKSQKLHAIADILGAVVGFAISIGTLVMGAGSSAPDIDKVIDTVEKVEQASKQANNFLKSPVLKQIFKGVYSIYKLYPDLKNAIHLAENIDKISTPTNLKDVQGGAADANAEVTLAAWDKWVLDSDDQMEYAVGQKIDGAAEFRTALRKHAINGKELARVEAEAIKAGQEYVHAALELHGAEEDLKRLDDLRQQNEKEGSISEEAEAKLFDRYLTIRTSIMILMRNLIWAYKYATLETPAIEMNVLGDIEEDQVAMTTLMQSFRQWQAKHFGGPSDLNTAVLQAQDFPPPFNGRLVQELRDHHETSFTYLPGVNGDFRYSGPFREGSHFRISGVELDLIGATSAVVDHNEPQFEFLISTSGIYSDVKDGEIYHFVGPQLKKPYSYNKDVKTGAKEIITPFTVDISDYTAPPPFTTWTIKIKNAQVLDLSKLTDITIKWHGKFSEKGF